MTEEAEVTFTPPGRRVDVPVGTTLLDAAEPAGVGIESLCGGEGLCGTCTVKLDAGDASVSDPTETEATVLSSEQLDDGLRLSCRCSVERPGTIDVVVPPESRRSRGIVLTEGVERSVDLDPAVHNHRLVLDPPALDDSTADRERVLAGLAADYDLAVDRVDYRLLRSLPGRLRGSETEDGLEVTATVYRERELIDLRPGFDLERYGVAADVGTTTIAVYLLDLDTGEVEAVTSTMNPQSVHGGDIMTRMRYCRNEPDGRGTLQSLLVDGLDEAIGEVARSAGVARRDIHEVVLVGNTAMHHLFLGIDPTHVSGSPYVAANHAPVAVKARELDLRVNEGGYAYWLPISGGWVGPDKVAVLLASGHHDEPGVTVCIDIGTNGEISVGGADGMLATSAPAGPALEGAELTDGVRAQPGAIDHVEVDPETFEPATNTIGDDPPIGICGSGVIDALAELFLVGAVDRRGTFTDALEGHPRLRRTDDGEREFVLVRADEAATADDIVLTQNDIRDVQMAKAAIQAGTNVLLDELGVDAIDRVVVAGGFGNYIDPDAARLIGLYPDTPPERCTSLGNGAGVGAQLALLDTASRAEARRIVDFVEYFEIAGTDQFQDHFMQAMYLPHQVFERHPSVRDRLESVRTPIDVERPMDGPGS